MALFNLAFTKTMEDEGGYVNHPNDPGGETYRGIARNRHPDWGGWARVDQYKNADAFPRVLDVDHALKGNIQEFYKEEFWNKIKGDDLQNQELAELVFDYAVHTGVKHAAIDLQRVLNILNREQKLWPDLVTDGQIGPKTLRALVSYAEWEGPALIQKALVGLRIAYYIEITEKKERNESFIRGWLQKRVKLR